MPSLKGGDCGILKCSSNFGDRNFASRTFQVASAIWSTYSAGHMRAVRWCFAPLNQEEWSGPDWAAAGVPGSYWLLGDDMRLSQSHLG